MNGKPIPKVRVQDYIEHIDGFEHHVPQYRETLPSGKSYLVLDRDPDGPLDNTGVYVVPPGHYFMMGDNRDNSADSRSEVGYVPAINLEGKAEFRFFSTNGTARFWQVWKWPFAIRYSRILTLDRLSSLRDLLNSKRSWATTSPIRALLKRALTHASADRGAFQREAGISRRPGAGPGGGRDAACPSCQRESKAMLTVRFHALVRAEACAKVAEAAGLPAYIKLAGSGFERPRGAPGRRS